MIELLNYFACGVTFALGVAFGAMTMRFTNTKPTKDELRREIHLREVLANQAEIVRCQLRATAAVEKIADIIEKNSK